MVNGTSFTMGHIARLGASEGGGLMGVETGQFVEVRVFVESDG